MGRSVTAFLMLMKTLGLPREQQTLPRVSTFFTANSYSSLQEKLDYWTFTSNFVLFSFLQPNRDKELEFPDLEPKLVHGIHILSPPISYRAIEGENVSPSVLFYSLHLCGLQPPGFSVYGILQARILEWVAISFSKGSS